MNKDWRTYVHIIWAIATKDIVDAVSSKTTLTIILGVLMTMLSGQALPFLLKMRQMPTAAVYDVGDARLVNLLRRRDDLTVYPVRSQAEMENVLTERTEAILGLVIPADFDAALAEGESVTLEAYVAHWVKAEDVTNLQAFFENEISDLTNHSVHINLSSTRLYPAPDVGGQPVMMTLSLVIATVLICTVLVPYLIIEEKEKHTLDALLVSPASIGQVVAGKAIAGAIYGLIAGAVALIFAQIFIVHWWVALLTIIGGTLFSVAVGLILGSIFDNAQNMGVWMGLMMMLFLIPAFAELMPHEDWPALPRTVLLAMPTALMSRLFRQSFTQTFPVGSALRDLSIIVLWSIPLYAIVIWRVRRTDR